MRFQSRPATGLLIGAAAGVPLLLQQPAQAHGMVHGSLAAGFLHPIAGIDHLLLLIGVGAAGAAMGPWLLLWALGGALLGGMAGAFGMSVPGVEILAALSVSLLGGILLLSRRAAAARDAARPLAGLAVAAAVAVHSLLHGHEAPLDGAASLWWMGVFTASLLLAGGAFLALRRVPGPLIGRIGVLLIVLGGCAALTPLAALTS